MKLLLSIKEEGKVLQNDINQIKEEIQILNAANQIMAEKISQLEDDCASDTDEKENTPERYQSRRK